jgi:hypothetical protein
MIIAVYVDDLLIFSASEDTIKSLKVHLNDRFSMKDLGPAKMCLGIQLNRDFRSGTSHLCQRAYIQGLQEHFKLTDP